MSNSDDIYSIDQFKYGAPVSVAEPVTGLSNQLDDVAGAIVGVSDELRHQRHTISRRHRLQASARRIAEPYVHPFAHLACRVIYAKAYYFATRDQAS
jgi:hypothetical protein